jgi:hypothetical protein
LAARQRRGLVCSRWLALLLCLAFSPGRADERLFVEARVNGKAARLIFDTGAGAFALFPQGARRLGLQTSGPPADRNPVPGMVSIGSTEECNLTIWNTTTALRLGIIEMPPYLAVEADGVLGWRPQSGNVFLIDALKQKVTPLEAVPVEARAWPRIPLLAHTQVLTLLLPDEEGRKRLVLVDTGSDRGVKLSPKRWEEWQRRNSRGQATLSAYYMPGAGLVVRQERWARELDFGALRLAQVPVMKANVAEVAAGGAIEYEATLGLAALKRLEFIVDGGSGFAYWHPRSGVPPPYTHNRLGAVFVPRDEKSDDLVAQVVEGTPAYEAGIRDGDTLLRIGTLDVTKWRTDPKVLPLSRFWELPRGTLLDLALKRGEQPYEITTRLRQILMP